MYVVTRTFRDANGVFEAGSIVEPADIKAFKSRVQQRHIVDVDEQNVDKWNLFFKNRHNIDLATKVQAYLDGTEMPVAPVEEVTEVTEVEEPEEEPEKPQDDEQTVQEEDQEPVDEQPGW